MSFIPMVSSSPPPMDHDTGGWDEDDDDFGDFASVNSVSQQNGDGFADFTSFKSPDDTLPQTDLYLPQETHKPAVSDIREQNENGQPLFQNKDIVSSDDKEMCLKSSEQTEPPVLDPDLQQTNSDTDSQDFPTHSDGPSLLSSAYDSEINSPDVERNDYPNCDSLTTNRTEFESNDDCENAKDKDDVSRESFTDSGISSHDLSPAMKIENEQYIQTRTNNSDKDAILSGASHTEPANVDLVSSATDACDEQISSQTGNSENNETSSVNTHANNVSPVPLDFKPVSISEDDVEKAIGDDDDFGEFGTFDDETVLPKEASSQSTDANNQINVKNVTLDASSTDFEIIDKNNDLSNTSGSESDQAFRENASLDSPNDFNSESITSNANESECGHIDKTPNGLYEQCSESESVRTKPESTLDFTHHSTSHNAVVDTVNYSNNMNSETCDNTDHQPSRDDSSSKVNSAKFEENSALDNSKDTYNKCNVSVYENTSGQNTNKDCVQIPDRTIKSSKENIDVKSSYVDNEQPQVTEEEKILPEERQEKDLVKESEEILPSENTSFGNDTEKGMTLSVESVSEQVGEVCTGQDKELEKEPGIVANTEHDDDFDDFADFQTGKQDEEDTPSEKPSPERVDELKEIEEEDEWSAFDNNEQQSAYTTDSQALQENNENNGDWAAFGSPPKADDTNGGDWAAFGASEPVVDIPVNGDDEDDEWNTFGNAENTTLVAQEEKSPSDDEDEFGDFGDASRSEFVGSETSDVPPPKTVQLKAADCIISGCFQIKTDLNGNLDCDPILLIPNMETPDCIKQEVVTKGSGKVRETKNLISVDRNVWNNLKDMEKTPALHYQWANSNSNQVLLQAIHVDTRNMLVGHKKPSVPIFAAGIMETSGPTLQPLVATPVNQTLGILDVNGPASSGNKQDIPPPDFDWQDSGLTNPLDVLDLNVLQPEASVDSIKSPAVKKEREILEALEPSPSKQPTLKNPSQPLHNLIAGIGTQRIQKALSKDAENVLKDLPELSFMRAKVLMFPLRASESSDDLDSTLTG